VTQNSDWHALEAAAVLRHWDSDPARGLGALDAQARLAKIGPNQLRETKKATALQQFLAQFTDFIILVLIGAALISGVLGEWADAIAILVIVVLNAILGFVQEYRAEQALEALKKLTAPTARVIRDGELTNIPAAEVVPGDILQLEMGDIVPADARLIDAHNLQAEEAALTGESTPVKKSAGALADPKVSLGDRKNMAFSSTIITYGKGTGVVVATGMETELGKIAGLVQAVEEGLTPLQQRLEQLGKLLVYACLIICAVVFAVGIWRDTSLDLLSAAGFPAYLAQYQHVVVDLFITAVALAVAAIPEGLPAVVTIALALGVRRMVQRHALVRKLPSVETLGSAQIICSDKTGTLTQNEMTVRKVYIPHRMVNVTGVGYIPTGEFRYEGSEKEPSERVTRVLRLAGTIAARCNNATLKAPQGEGAWSIMGDPTEAALLTVAGKLNLWAWDLDTVYPFRAEIPFDAERKRMTVVAEVNGGHGVWLPNKGDLPPAVAFMKGAPEVVLAHCSHVYDGREVRPLDEEERQGILAVNEDLAEQALRVLGVAYRGLAGAPDEEAMVPDEIERDMTFVALLAMIDPPRPEVKEAVRKCDEAGITPVMITGDHLGTAQAIARELGILAGGEQAVSGAELDAMGKVKLGSIVEDVRVYARVSAEHKLRIVRAWRDRGYVVAMTGDGVNDAPAVKEADIGIAMGITGTDVTKEASDMVLTDDNFASIVAAIEEGRAIFDNIRRFIHYLISCNIGEVLAMFCASLLGMPLPLLPIQILWINLATDSLPALALGVEPPEPDLMRRPPRPAREGIINRSMAVQMFLQGTLIGAVTLGAFALEYYVLGSGDADRARVIAFSTSILAQNLHAFNCRSREYSIFQLGLFTNPALIGAFAVVVLSELAIIYLPFFQPIFKTMSLTLNDWAVVVALGVIPLVVMEAYKLTRWALRKLRGR